MKELDFSDFPPGSVTEYTTLVCLACIFDIFTKQIGLAPRSAYSEIKRYSPTVEELTSRKAVRPFFDSGEKHPRCPYCNAAKRWHARLDTYAIEGGKTTDAPRRKFVKSVEKKKDQFAVIEAKSDRRSACADLVDGPRRGRQPRCPDDRGVAVAACCCVGGARARCRRGIRHATDATPRPARR